MSQKSSIFSNDWFSFYPVLICEKVTEVYLYWFLGHTKCIRPLIVCSAY